MNINNSAQQAAEKSTTVWSQPSNEAQRRYFSKHSPKRRAYGVIQTMFQVGHAALAFAAWATIYYWALERWAFLLPAVPVLSLATLSMLHWLLRVTWSTFWYDRLDDDPNTDSSVFLPILIIALLLVTEWKGAQQYMLGQVKPPTIAPTTGVDSSYNHTTSGFQAEYQQEVAQITSTLDAKIRAAAAPYNGEIANLKARGARDDAERRYIATKIRQAEAQRTKATATAEQGKADALAKALADYQARKGTEAQRRDAKVLQIDQANQRAVTDHQSEVDSVGGYAWILSIIILGLILGLGYARVRINVKSGILPLRNYTVLDAHGSVPERLHTAISDAANRRSLQLAVFVHRLLSPRKAITSFDGTVVAQPGTYNTPHGFFNTPSTATAAHTPPPPAPEPAQSPTPPSDSMVYEKVIRKLMAESAQSGVQVTPALLKSELQKAAEMNGHYMDEPLPGKP
jgi:hypothetical protein